MVKMRVAQITFFTLFYDSRVLIMVKYTLTIVLEFQFNLHNPMRILE